MKYEIIIKNADNTIRVQQQVENGDVIPVEAGDEVFILDEAGNPANAKLIPQGSDLLVVFPGDGLKFTLDEYFSSGGEGELIHINLSATSDVSEVYDLFSNYADGASTGAPDQQLLPTAAGEGGQQPSGDFDGVVGNLPQGDEFTLMRLSNLGYAEFDQTFTSFGNDLSRGLTPDETPPAEGFGGGSNSRDSSEDFRAFPDPTDPTDPTDPIEVVETPPVAPANRPPIAVDDVAGTPEDTAVIIDLLGNDRDPDGDSIRLISAVAGNGTVVVHSNGTVTYTPNPNFNGPDTIIYRISDPSGKTDTGRAIVNVSPVNDPPVAVNDVATTDEDTPIPALDVLGNDSDLDGDPLTVISASAPNGTVAINPDGTLSYTPNLNFNGPDTITYTIQDPSGETSTATVAVTVNPVNDAPVAADDANALAEDDVAAATGNVLGNDTDVDGDALVVSQVNGLPGNVGIAVAGTYGTVTIGADGSYSYALDNANPAVQALAVGETLTDTFTYLADDGNGGTDTATLTLTINGTNDAPPSNPPGGTPGVDPGIYDDADSISEDDATPATGNVLDNDVDRDTSDVLTVTEVNGLAANLGNAVAGSYGAVTIASDGVYSYALNNANPAVQALGVGQSLTDSFTYTADDGNGGSATATLTITINGTNDAPAAADDVYSGIEDTPFLSVLGVDDVLVNDSDIDGDTLTVNTTPVSGPSNGVLALNADGTFTYTPNANFNGADSFVYEVSDGHGGTAQATATINIAPVNDPPVAVDDAATTDEDTPILNLNILGNDTDVDGDPLTLTAVPTAPNGTVTVNLDGTINYTPNPNFNGVDTITYTIQDPSGATDTAIVTVTVNPVNDAPVATDNTYAGTEDTTVNGNVITDDTGAGVDSDIEGSPLSVTQFSVGLATYAAGTTVNLAEGDLTINGDGSFSFVPAANYNGPVPAATYTLSDGSLTDTATLGITLAAVNDAPVATDNTYAGTEDITVSGNVITDNTGAGVDSDLEGNPLSVTQFVVGAGTYAAGDTANLAEGDLTINGDGSFTFVPAANYNGSVPAATYTLSDGSLTDTATLGISVAAVNDAPVATDNSYAGTEDVTVSGNVITDNTGAGVDSDAEGSPLSVTQFAIGLVTYAAGATANVAEGDLTINGDGSFTFVPAANYNGPVPAATYTLSDGALTDTATLGITLAAVNDAPVATDNTYTGTEDITVSGNVITDNTGAGVDSDVEGSPLTVTQFTIGLATYAAGTTVNLAEGDLTINADGSFSFVPAANYNGPVPAVTYTLSDGALTDTASLGISLSAVNDPPVATDDVYTGSEDTTLTGNVITGNTGAGVDSDLEGNPLSVTQFTIGAATYAAGTTVNLAQGDLTINADGSFSFVPAANYNGAVPAVTYTLSDGALTDTATLGITVAAVNDAPVATDNTYVGTEDTTVTGNVITDNTGAGVDSDLEGSPLSVTQFVVGAGTYAAGATANLAEGDLTINGDGSFSFVPAANYNGPVPAAAYTLSDGSLTDTGALNISLSAVNDAPVATNDVYTGTEDTTVTGNVITDDAGGGVDSDPDGNPLSVTQFVVGATTYAAGATANLAQGDLTINADGSFSFVPASNYNGPVPAATYTVSDGVLTDSGVVNISLNAAADAPVATDNTYVGTEDVTLSGNVITDNTGAGVDSDVDLDALSVTEFIVGATTYAAGVTANLAEGDLTINGDGSFTFVPALNYNGPIPATTYILSDGALTDSDTLNISLNPVNDAPVAADVVYAGTEDATLTGNVITDDTGAGVDSDPDGDPLSVTQFVVGATTYAAGATANLAEGDLTINGDGSFTFVPATNYNGPVPAATYTLSDGVLTDTASFSISLTAVNDAPLATDNTHTGTEDVVLNGNVLTDDTGAGVDSDPEGSPLSVTGFLVGATAYAAGATANLAEGDLTINGDGSFTFAPAANFNGAVPAVTYTVSDGALTDSASLNLTFTEVNNPPVATDNSYTSNEENTVTGNVITDNTGSGVDRDVEGAPLSVTQFVVGATTYLAGATANLAEGDLTINGDGSFSFVPTPNYFGAVPSATYTLSDGLLSDTAALSLTLNAVDDAPVATANTHTALEDVTVTGNVLTGDTGAGVDSDVDGDPLTVAQFTVGATTYAAGTTVNLAEGDLTINANGSFTFVPAPNYNGPVPATTYTVNDGTLTDTAALNLTFTAVNDAPVATDNAYTGPEDGALSGNVITDNTGAGVDSDVEGSPLSVTQFVVGATTYAAGATANLAEGDLTINGDGTFTFVPAASYFGPVPAATYTLSDGALTDTASLNLTLTPINDAPAATDNTYIGLENVTVSGNVITDNTGAGVDSDLEGAPLSVTQFVVGATTYAAGATANLAEGNLTINGDGSFTFVPAASYAGPVPAATYTLSDGALTDTAALNISFSAVNDAPIATDNTYAGTEDLTVSGNVITDDTGAGVDSDIDGNPIRVTQFVVGATTYLAGVTANLAEGDLTINSDGSFTFVPAANYNGPVPAAAYTLSDGLLTDTASLNISLGAVNDAPVATNNTYAGTEDVTLSGNVITGNTGAGVDSDVEGSALSVTQFVVGATTYLAGATANLAEGALTINGNGSFTFVPTANFTGAVPAATYTLSDGALTDTATLNINLSPVNDAPVARDNTYTGNEDSTITGNLIEDNTGAGVDSDVDGNPLSVTEFVIGATTYAAGATANLAEGDLTVNGDGSFTFVPAANYFGPVPVASYTLSDGLLTDTAALGLTIVLNPVNDAPVATDNTYTANEDVALSGNVITDDTGSGVDSDVDGDSLSVANFRVGATTYSAGTTANLAEGALTINSNGNFTFVPAPNYYGPVPVATYTVSDGTLSDTGSLTLTVNGSPTVTSSPTNGIVYEAGLPEGTGSGPTATTFGGLFTLSDPEGNPLTLNLNGVNLGALDGNPATVLGSAPGEDGNGTLTIFGDGSWSYQLQDHAEHDADEGSYVASELEQFTITVTDSGGSVSNPLTLTAYIVDDPVQVVTPAPDAITNQAGATTSGALTTSGADVYTASLADNVTGWNGTTTTFAGSGLTSGGNDVYYFVDPANTGQLIAYTDTSGSPTAYDPANPNQSLVFTLDALPNTDLYQMTMSAPLDTSSGYSFNFSDLSASGPQATYRFTDAPRILAPTDPIPPGETVIFTAFGLRPGDTVNANNSYMGINNNLVNANEIGMAIDIQATGVGVDVSVQFVGGGSNRIINWVAYDVTDSVVIGTGSYDAGAASLATVEIDVGGAAMGRVDILAQDSNTTSFRIGTIVIVPNAGSSSVDLNFAVDVTDSDGDTVSTVIEITAEPPAAPPVVIDLNGDGARFDGIERGIAFDIDGDSQLEQTAWADESDAVLVYDRNGDGLVTDRSEISFTGYVEGAQTDLEGLRHFDTDGDLMLTVDDAEFQSFHLWQDSNGNGLVDEGEFRSLSDAGIQSIGLVSDGQSYYAANGDVLVHGESIVQFADGSTTTAADASFSYLEGAGLVEPAGWDAPLEVVANDGQVINLDAPPSPEPAPAAAELVDQAAPPAGPAGVQAEAAPPVLDDALASAAAAAM